MSVLPYGQRRAWLLSEIEKEKIVDVLNEDFVMGYAEHTGAKYRPSFFGAGWCGLLSRDLSRMVKLRQLKRSRHGLSAFEGGPGFPKWYYSYQLTPYGVDLLNEIAAQAQAKGE